MMNRSVNRRSRFSLSWTLVSLMLLGCLLAGCSKPAEEDQRPLPPVEPESKGALTMDADTVATIYLRGYPNELVVDEAGQIVVTSGLENLGVGTYVLLQGGGQGVRPEAIASYRWTLQGPAGSQAALDDPHSPTPTFIPDVAGAYQVALSIANQAGVEGKPTSLTIRAGTWVGNGAIRGASEDPHQCAECHPDKIATWLGTRHAVTLKRAMEGRASPYYFENCILCHTVGNNAIADNGGFDDVARELNWRYPEELKLGNYAALVADYPRLANLGNTQCEACHGPGDAHEEDDGLIAISFRPELCIQCHDFLQQDQHAQWQRSGHADTSLPQIFPEGISEPICSSCHTSHNFVAAVDGTEIVPGGPEQLTCQACHDPHAAPGANFYQVRIYGSVQLPDGSNLSNMGSSALCIHCHNVGETIAWVEHDYDPLLPPPQSAAAEMLAGVGGYTYGETVSNSPHARAFASHLSCVDCHMISASSQETGDFLSATMNEPVGEHTFLVRNDNGTPGDPGDDYENLRACEGCHGEISRLNGPAAADYDGNGQVQGVQDEVQGLLDLVKEQLVQAGVAWHDQAPYWGPADNTALRAAVYNWSYVNNDGSRGIHNTARAVELLQITYRDLAGREVPGATLRADQEPASGFQARLAAEKSFLEELSWVHFVIPLALLLLLGAVASIGVAAYRSRDQ